MGVVDTLMVGPLGRRGARRRGYRQQPVHRRRRSSGWACCSGSTRRWRQSFGAGDVEECDRWLIAGLWLALDRDAATRRADVGAAAGSCHTSASTRTCSHTSSAYFPIVALSLPPLLLYAALRRYLQARSRVGRHRVHAGVGQPRQRRSSTAGPDLRPRSAPPNWACVAPPGRRCISRIYMVAVLAWVVWRLHRRGPATDISRGHFPGDSRAPPPGPRRSRPRRT